MLAIAALALQIVLSFGHVHLAGLHPAGVSTAVVAAPQKDLADAERQAPAQSPGNDDDYCAICASICLASTTFISHAPPLPLPSGFERIGHFHAAAGGSSEPLRVAFRSRAPPAA